MDWSAAAAGPAEDATVTTAAVVEATTADNTRALRLLRDTGSPLVLKSVRRWRRGRSRPDPVRGVTAGGKPS
ncbi:hypothetical protein GCM10027168_35810 [Streptomyces capparidis]